MYINFLRLFIAFLALITIMHDFLQFAIHCQQCRCGVFRSGGPGLEPHGVPSVDPPGQEDLIVAEATTSGVHHLEGEGEADQEEGGRSLMLIMVQ
jgi:hypothetical protein